MSILNSNNKIKIFHLITSVQLGGAEILVFNLIENCCHLFPDLFDFTIVELYTSQGAFADNQRKALKRKNIKIIALSKLSKRKSLVFSPIKLFSLLKKEHPHIIHTHTDLPDFVFSITLRFLPHKAFKVVRTIHSTKLWPTYKRIGKFVESKYIDDFIIGVSHAALNAYKSLRQSSTLKESCYQKVINNGCPLPKYSDIEIGLSKDKINIGICGRLEEVKGTDLLISFLKRNNHLLKAHFNFYFIGKGTLEDQVKELVTFNNNIELHPPIVGISNKLQAFDFILIPSRVEGFGLISAEASLVKVPVIASEIDGLKNTLPKDWPLFFKWEKESTLMDVFNKIQHDEIDRTTISEKAFLFASERFSIKKMAQSYVDIYKMNS